MASNIISTKQTIAEINEILSKNITLLNQGAESFTKYAQSHKLPSEYVNSLRNIDDTQKKIVKSQQELEKQERKMQQTRLAELRLAKQREQAFDKYDAQLKREEAQQARNIKRQNEANRAFVKLNNERTVAAKRLQDLIAAGNANNATLRQAQVEFNKLDARVRMANNAVRDGRMDVGRYHLAAQGLIGTLRNLMGAFGLTSGVFLFAQALRNGIETIKEFDGGLKDVSKTTGLTGTDLGALGEDVINLSEKLRVVGVKALLDYATVAGQLGVKGRENILNFAESLAVLETASDISGEEGGRNIARLLTIVDGGVENVSDFADEIVILGNNFAATENEILGNATAIAQNTGVYRLGRKEVLAYATATKAVGLEAEIVGSTIGRTLAVLEEAILTGKNLTVVTNLLGKSQEELQKEFKANASGVLTDFVAALAKVDKEGGSVNAQLNELGVTAVRDKRVIASLATGGFDVLTRALEDVNNASGAALQEFETASSKLSLSWSNVTNAIDRFILSLEDGNNLLGRATVKTFDLFAKAVDNVTIALESVSNGFELSREQSAKFTKNVLDALPVSNRFTEALSNKAQKVIEVTEKLKKYRAEINAQAEAFVKANGSLAPLVEKTEDYFALLRGESQETTEKSIDTIQGLRNEISDLNKAIEESARTDIAGIRAKQEKIKTLQSELDAILGVEKATKEAVKASRERIEAIGDELKGTEFLKITIEEQIKSFEKLANKYADGTKEAEMFAEKVRQLKIALGEVSALDVSGADAEITAFIQPFLNDDPSQDGSETFENNWRDTFQTVADLAGQTMGLVSQISNAQFQQQFADLEAQRQQALAFAGDSAEAQLEVERQFNEKRKEIQRKQAEAQKQQAIFDIIINTAAAVVRALPNIPLSVAVGALGAAQLAFVAAQQIPQFWEGGVVGSEQKIMVNDDPYGKKGANYREVIEKPNGQILTPKGKNVKMTVPKGTIVHPTYDAFMNSLNTELLGNNIMPIGMGNLKPMIMNNGLSKDEITDVMNVHAGKIVNTINKQHGINISIDENGISKYVTKKGITSKIMNARFNGTGRRV
jgi:TP901 family phage tail tape measure protein